MQLDRRKFLHTHIDQEQLSARFRQCAIVEQRELVRFSLEFLLISAVAELVRQGPAEAVQRKSAVAPEGDSVLQIWGIRGERTQKDIPND